MKIRKIFPRILLIYYLLTSILYGVIKDDTSIKYIPFIAIIFFLLVLKKRFRVDYRTAIWICIFFGYIFVNFLIASHQELFFSRLVYYVLLPLCIVFTIKISLYDEKQQIISRVTESKICMALLNIFCLLNIVVIQIQAQGIPIFIQFDKSIFAYYDQIDGFFGVNGTPNWSLFLCLMCVINYIAYRRNGKITYIVITFIEVVLGSIQSLANDNKGLFVVLFLTLILLYYHFLKSQKNNRKKLIRYFFAAVIVLILFSWIFNSSNDIASYIRVKVFGYIFMPFGYTGEVDLMHTNERWDTFIYALENLNGYGIGMGIGWDAKVTSISHFGISELSSKTGYGGIIYYLLWVCFCTHICLDKKLKINKNLLIGIIWIVFSLFTRVYTDYHLCVIATFYVLLMGYIYSPQYDIQNYGRHNLIEREKK